MLNKILLVGIIFLFICSSFASGINDFSYEENLNKSIGENILISCSTYGISDQSSIETVIPVSEAEALLDKINELAYESSSKEAEKLQQEILELAKEYNLLPKGTSLEDFKPHFMSSLSSINPNKEATPVNGNRGTASICNFATTGSGMQFPIIILLRLIPILQLPIPRLFIHWNANEGITSYGSLLTGKGFIAEGMQSGTALGFWGVGFSVFLPPFMGYGFIGYSLYSTCTAENMEPWPPNNAPIISNENPSNGKLGISISTNELSFTIEDPDGDKMDYQVTTSPDIGSGSGSNKNDGTYTVPISNLEYTTAYTWTVEVTDSVDNVGSEFSFFTEELPFDPFDEGWQYRKKVTIDHTKVNGNIENFPVLIATFDNDLKTKAQNDGDDILFMDNNGIANKLYHEIESYNGDSGELVAWVNVDEISSYEDTVLYIYYGNSECGNQQLPEKVWNSNYLTVLHMNDNPDSQNIKDSTIHDNSGTKRGYNEPMETMGKIGKGQDFDGTDDYIDTKDFDIDNDFTISLWINPSLLHEGQCFIGKHTSSKENIALFGYWEKETSGYTFHIRNSKFRGGNMTSDWQQMVYIGEKTSSSITKATVYKNGELLWQNNLNKCVDNTLGKPWTIGQDWDYEGRTDFYKGSIDEIRIANGIKSPEWISTEYNNQNDPTSFFSFGPEEIYN